MSTTSVEDNPAAANVLRLRDSSQPALLQMLRRYGLTVEQISAEQAIPGSFWGDEEAGLRHNVVFAHADTPVHSILHEACHFVCMDPDRRAALDTNAGGDYAEENGVCYLQILLAEQLAGVGRDRIFGDMDAWGYSFRLGSARAWFERDAEDAHAWLQRRDIISPAGRVTWRLCELASAVNQPLA